MKLLITAFFILLSWFITYTVITFVFFNILGPLLYLPYVLYKICKKELMPSAILACCVAPIVWSIVFVFFFFLLGLLISQLTFNSDIASTMLGCVFAGGAIGTACAFCAFITNIFSKQAREEFITKLNLYKT